MCAKEGGKEKMGKTLRRFASLLFSFPWSHALRHQSLAFRDYLTFVWKTKHCPEEEAQDPCMKEQFLWKSLRKQDIQSIYNRCHIIEHFICKPDKRFKRMVNTVVGGGGGARVARWWEHSPPTNVAQIPILASTPCVGWVCCWFSPWLRDVFLRVPRFRLTLKTNPWQIPIRSRTHGHVSKSS